MRRAPVADLITPRIGAWLNGAEAVIAVFIRQYPAAAAEIGVDGRQILILFMSIAAAGVGLPHLDQRVFHRAAEAVAHVAVDNNTLANRQTFFGVIKDQVIIQRAEIVVAEYRAGNFGQNSVMRSAHCAVSAGRWFCSPGHRRAGDCCSRDAQPRAVTIYHS